MGNEQYYGQGKWIRVKESSFRCRTCSKKLAPLELAWHLRRSHDVLAYGGSYP